LDLLPILLFIGNYMAKTGEDSLTSSATRHEPQSPRPPRPSSGFIHASLRMRRTTRMVKFRYLEDLENMQEQEDRHSAGLPALYEEVDPFY